MAPLTRLEHSFIVGFLGTGRDMSELSECTASRIETA
jgi:hypothetical protein